VMVKRHDWEAYPSLAPNVSMLGPLESAQIGFYTLWHSCPANAVYMALALCAQLGLLAMALLGSGPGKYLNLQMVSALGEEEHPLELLVAALARSTDFYSCCFLRKVQGAMAEPLHAALAAYVHSCAKEMHLHMNSDRGALIVKEGEHWPIRASPLLE